MTAPLGSVLVVDDEPQIHRFLKPALTAAGYEGLRAESGGEALKLSASRAPDAILLDLGLPDMDGQDVLTRLRAFFDGPLLVLSARDREAEKIRALDAGADDYVEKPFALGELLARLRAALRRQQQRQHGAGGVLSIGALVIDPADHRVTLQGKPVALTRREHALLFLLATNLGRVLTHRQILTAIWGHAHIEDVAYLRVYVGQLRRKLGEDVSRLIVTEPGIGYRFLGEA